MKKQILAALALLTLACLSPQAAPAQFPVEIKIPRPGRPKPKPTPAESARPAPTTSETPPATQPQPNTPAATNPVPAAAAQGQPGIVLPSLQVTARTLNFHGQNRKMWSWVPFFRFSLAGERGSGDVHYVEYAIPGSPALKFDCEVNRAGDGFECGGRSIPEDKGSIYTGSIPFTIKARNELQGTDAALFTGKMKVARVCTGGGPCSPTAGEWVYYVDHDWNLPIGYVWYTPDPVSGWNLPKFNAAFWARGSTNRMEPHLFYQGKEIALRDGQPNATCSARLENEPTHTPYDMVGGAKWSRVECGFGIYRWDKTNDGRGQPNTSELFKTASNPGEYEFKLLWNNKLARSIKFTVGPDGRLDNGIASANKLGTERVVVPVQIIGDQDGAWDKNAWKTEAFYGRPLVGFTPAP